ncbi:myb/SANT-like DNA-binding domain-containing protein 3 [Eurosta solidaginis]|uniref:myb/SANT-like DNA-binding domain-containing protein 3 n=1 Tax=Eurosta solidaginis TaxID=178769 RepID=UPI0035314831
MSDQKRASNFSSAEIDKLLLIVETKKCIMECKKTDRVSVDMKEKCWDEISLRFNAEFGTGRSKKVLKDKYSNLKKSLKKTKSEVRKSLYTTGGGPASSHTYSPSDEHLMRIAHDTQTSGRGSQYDGGHTMEDVHANSGEDFENEVVTEEGIVEVLEDCEDKEDVNVNWNKYTPSMLKSAKSAKLAPNLRQSSKSSWDDLAETKKIRAEKDLEMRIKEHDMNVRREEEGRPQRLLEHEQRMRHAEEEHQIRMKILKTDLQEKQLRLQSPKNDLEQL